MGFDRLLSGKPYRAVLLTSMLVTSVLAAVAWGPFANKLALAEGEVEPAATGQTASYRSGDDGDLQQGVAPPDPHFVNNGDGTVTDDSTGLVWTQTANAAASTSNWNDAVDFCNALADGTAGLSDASSAGDWRLPNLRELESLVDYSLYAPAVDSGAGLYFSNVQSNAYWTSTTSTYQTADAWQVYMGDGRSIPANKTNTAYVWAVRNPVPEPVMQGPLALVALAILERRRRVRTRG
jgi:hypothetical protein